MWRIFLQTVTALPLLSSNKVNCSGTGPIAVNVLMSSYVELIVCPDTAASGDSYWNMKSLLML